MNFCNFLHTSEHRVMVEDSSLVSCHQCGDKFESKHQLRNHMAGLRHHMMTPYGKQVGEDVHSSNRSC